MTAANKNTAGNARNKPAAEAAAKDSTVASAQSESGVTGTHGSEAVQSERKTASKSGTYTVKDGDSLESVARETGMEPTEIAALNPEIAAEGRGSNFLYTGQTLRLK